MHWPQYLNFAKKYTKPGFCMEAHIYRSGTEEEYDELSQMLEDIASYQRNVSAVLNQEKKEKKKKELEDKKNAEVMRNSAMETMSSKLAHYNISWFNLFYAYHVIH